MKNKEAEARTNFKNMMKGKRRTRQISFIYISKNTLIILLHIIMTKVYTARLFLG
jgi:hypothetical protein